MDFSPEPSELSSKLKKRFFRLTEPQTDTLQLIPYRDFEIFSGLAIYIHKIINKSAILKLYD